MNTRELGIFRAYNADRLAAIKKFGIAELHYKDIPREVELDAEDGVIQLRVDDFYFKNFNLLLNVLYLWCKQRKIKWIYDTKFYIIFEVK
jgi:hypothetical protein